MAPKRITLSFSSARHCSVLVGCGAWAELVATWAPSWRQAAIIGDDQVIRAFGERIAATLTSLVDQVEVLPFPAGEQHKSRRTKAELEDRLLDAGFSRQTCIVGLGGGVSLDLAGFVAATYLRGVPSLYLPTSLLAQVDGAIGGKTAVNTDRGKNLIGAFHQPAAVLIDPEALPSVPPAEWPNGLAELCKHGMVADADLFEWLEQHVDEIARPTVLDPFPLERSAAIKGAIVSADEREADRRAVLNFGHTIGHALERASDFAVPHGRAIALGMLVEGRVAVARHELPERSLARLEALLGKLGLAPEQAGALPPFATVEPHLWQDKKRRQRELRLALPADVGVVPRRSGSHTVATTAEELASAWRSTLGRKGVP
jgi:3-dehydroquinate synthase